MHYRKAIVTLTAIFLIGSGINAQECGDVNGDGNQNIVDITIILCSILSDGSDCDPFYPSVADIDGRAGITIADASAHVDSLLNGQSLDCSAAGSYSFPLSVEDTLFMPAFGAIPEDILELRLPIKVAYSENVDAFYLPILPNPGPNWEFTGVQSNSGTAAAGSYSSIGDTAIMHGINIEYIGNKFVRTNTSQVLIYERIAPGPSTVTPTLIDRDGVLKYGLEKDGDMIRPTVVYTTYFLPDDTILVSESSLHFESASGNPSPDSVMIHFTSNNDRFLQFSLTPSEPWIQIISFTMIEQGTPDSVLVTINSSLAPVGSSFGTITVMPWDESVTPSVEQIEITAEVLPPLLYPSGDFDCDGVVDIADLTYLILYLFMDGTTPEHCN